MKCVPQFHDDYMLSLKNLIQKFFVNKYLGAFVHVSVCVCAYVCCLCAQKRACGPSRTKKYKKRLFYFHADYVRRVGKSI